MFIDLAGPKWQRLVRLAAILAVGLLVAVGLFACGGGGGASKSEIAAAEKRGRTIKAEKEKERKLENEIHELKKERDQEKGGSSPTGSAPAAQAPVAESDRTSCGGSLSVGPDTTCRFAENVRAEYEYEIGSGSGTVYAYSAANNEIYEMFCTASPHECSGAINATVFFP